MFAFNNYQETGCEQNIVRQEWIQSLVPEQSKVLLIPATAHGQLKHEITLFYSEFAYFP